MINKLKENIFLKSTIILLIGGVLGKLVGFVLKIIVTRKLGPEGMGIYSMLNPTISLLSVLAVSSYPTAISKIISEKSSNTKTLFLSIIPVSIIINIILIIIVILLSKTLSIALIKTTKLYIPIICISLTMPFISISSIIKGYFWGKQNMFPYMLSNFIEQLTRITLISLFINRINEKGIIFSICFILIVNIIGEIISQIVMLNFINKNKFKNLKFKIYKNEIIKIFKITIPATSSKIIGSISYFLEPIILTNILLYMGYNKSYIIYEYGIINAYALSTLLMPQFFIQNMSTSLIPEISKYFSQNNIKMCKKRIKQVILLSCFIGSISTIIITIFPKLFLNLLYHNTSGIEYIRLLSPFTVIFYIETPLINTLQALGKSKNAMKCSIIGSIIRLLTIVIFALLKFGIYSYIISIIINLIISTYMYYNVTKKVLN